MSKFAPITASLLARKGDATPSAMPQPKQSWMPTPQPAQPSPPPPPPYSTHREDEHKNHAHDSDKPRRLFVPLSHEEYERLAIAAVKKNATQHQIVHAALEDYFKKLAADAQCQCIAGDCTRGCAAN